MNNIWKGLLVFDLIILGLMEICLFHTFTAESYIPIIIVHYLELLRFNSTFLLYRREKMAIWGIMTFTLVFGVLYLSGMFNQTFVRMSEFPDIVMGSEKPVDDFYSTYYTVGRNTVYECIIRGLFLWAWLMPIIVYAILFFFKKTEKRNYSWKQLAGLTIFYDHAGKFFVSLCILVFIALLSGYHMQEGISYYAIIILPMVAFYFMNKFIGRKAHWIEYVLILVAMMIFNKAQYRCDTERVIRLVLSPAIVMAVCVWMMAQSKKVFIPVLAFLMIAFLLPVLSIGYNIYTVLDGKRGVNYSDLDTRQGVLYVNNRRDVNGQMQIRFGLRDRYGEILPCVYRSIFSSNPVHSQVTCRTEEGGEIIYNVDTKTPFRSYSTQDSTLNVFVYKEILEPLMYKGYTEGQIIVMESRTGKIRSMAGFTDPLGGKPDFSEPVKCSGLMMPVSLMAAMASDTYLSYSDSVVSDERTSNMEDALMQESYKVVGQVIKKAYGEDINRFWWNLQEIGFCHYNDRAAHGLGNIDTIRFCQYPVYEEMDDSTIANLAIGIDRPVTALQMLDLYNIVANNGQEYRPLLYEDFPKSRESKLRSYDLWRFREIFEKSYDANCKKYGVENKGVDAYYTTYVDRTDKKNSIVYTNVCGYTQPKGVKYTFIFALKGDESTMNRKYVLEGINKLVNTL